MVQVLYVYEIQISSSLQRKGVGKFLMQLAELIAKKTGMKVGYEGQGGCFLILHLAYLEFTYKVDCNKGG
jgi:hypothetical protein